MGAERRKTKVAVLGGGVAGVTAAFELTATPALQDRYDVTVYQMGWRLGGKCASGRNAAMGHRIEEHGLHVWFGFYANAFSLMRRCYEELGRGAHEPLATFDDAFAPCDQIVLGEDYDGGWVLHTYDAPRNDVLPGTGDLPSFWDLVDRGLEWAITEWRSVNEPLPDVPATEPSTANVSRADEIIANIADGLDEVEDGARTFLLRVARRLMSDVLDQPGPSGQGRRRLVAKLLKEVSDSLWALLRATTFANDRLRNFVMTFDLGASLLTGIIHDDVLGNGFDHLEDEELRAWLTRHGADPYTLEHSPILRGWYAGGFAFEGGDTTKPNVAAGTALHAILRIFTYEGSVLRKMQAGMGETVFTPLYEVLQARGVHVEFFHRVEELHLTTDRKAIGAIDVVEQAQLAQGAYDPLVTVKGLACWPSEPHWDQLVDGDALRDAGLDLEHGDDGPGATTRTLQRGEDFDHVVLAIPVAGLPAICGQLIEADARFGAMVAHTATTMTQAIQLWAKRSPAQLGWPHQHDSILTSYVEPVDTYADMTHLLQHEDWPTAAEVANIAYFCGVLCEDAVQGRAPWQAKAQDNARRFVASQMAALWPEACRGAGGAFDWEVLVDDLTRPGATGEDRMRGQYVRANVAHTERYTLSLAGKLKHRLRAHESGFANLVLAGDWTRNGIDAGCVEATVMSGMQASRAICGQPERVVGERRDWLRG